MSNLGDRSSPISKAAIKPIAACLAEACERIGVSEDDVVDFFIELTDAVGLEGFKSGEEFETHFPEIFESVVRDNEIPESEDINVEVHRLIEELESGDYSRHLYLAIRVLNLILQIKTDVLEMVPTNGFK